MQDSTNC